MAEYDKLAKEYYQRRGDKARFDYNRDIEVPVFIKILINKNAIHRFSYEY
jgi:hypothetical protein